MFIEDGFKWPIVSMKESCHLEQLVGPGPLIIGTAEAGGDEGVHSTGLEIEDEVDGLVVNPPQCSPVSQWWYWAQ